MPPLVLAFLTSSFAFMSIKIYSKDYCPYCIRAKQFLVSRGFKVVEVDITNDLQLQEKCFSRTSGQKTVPQIFVGDYHIGGYDNMMTLVKTGEFDEIIKKFG